LKESVGITDLHFKEAKRRMLENGHIGSRVNKRVEYQNLKWEEEKKIKTLYFSDSTESAKLKNESPDISRFEEIKDRKYEHMRETWRADLFSSRPTY